MKISYRGLPVLVAMTAGPAMLIAADAVLYPRSVSVLALPAAAAVLLLVLGLTSPLVALHARTRDGTDQPIAPLPHLRETLYVTAIVLALLLLGPRIGLPIFGFVFSRVMGASWAGAATTGIVCAALVEGVLVWTLGHVPRGLP